MVNRLIEGWATFLPHECGLLWQQDKRNPQLGVLPGVEGKCPHQRPHHTPLPPQPDCICSIKPHLTIIPRDRTVYEMIPCLLHPTPIRPFLVQNRALCGMPSFALHYGEFPGTQIEPCLVRKTFSIGQIWRELAANTRNVHLSWDDLRSERDGR